MGFELLLPWWVDERQSSQKNLGNLECNLKQYFFCQLLLFLPSANSVNSSRLSRSEASWASDDCSNRLQDLLF